jgi:hypothetical protein
LVLIVIAAGHPSPRPVRANRTDAFIGAVFPASTVRRTPARP